MSSVMRSERSRSGRGRGRIDGDPGVVNYVLMLGKTLTVRSLDDV